MRASARAHPVFAAEIVIGGARSERSSTSVTPTMESTSNAHRSRPCSATTKWSARASQGRNSKGGLNRHAQQQFTVVIGKPAEDLVAAMRNAVDSARRDNLGGFASQDGKDFATSTHGEQTDARPRPLIQRCGQRRGGAVRSDSVSGRVSNCSNPATAVFAGLINDSVRSSLMMFPLRRGLGSAVRVRRRRGDRQDCQM